MPRIGTLAQIDADLAGASRIARRFLRLKRRGSRAARVTRRADLGLAVQWGALIAVTYFVSYAHWGWIWKAAILLPWSLYSGLAISNIQHYAAHGPLFQTRAANVAWRLSGIFVFETPLEYRHAHMQHHRLDNGLEDPVTTLESPQRHQSFWVYVVRSALLYPWFSLPWAPMLPAIRALSRTSRSAYREIVVARWASLVWVVALLVVDWRDTLLFLLPVTLLAYPLASNAMSLTDHVPGDPGHPFRQATYFEPRTRWQRFLCAVNHDTAATHLTHHLFPKVHWVFLMRLQRRIAGTFRRHDAPESLVCNSFLLGNPFRLLTVLRAVDRRRSSLLAGLR